MRTQRISIVGSLWLVVAALNLVLDLQVAKAAGFVTNTTVLFPEVTIPLPGYLQSYIDPAFGTTITRVTQTLTSGPPVSWGDNVRHHYSLDQAWSAGMTHLMIYNDAIGGVSASPGYLLMNGQNYTFDRSLGFTPDDIRWHPTDDNLMIYTKNNSLYRYHVTERTSELIHTFTEYSNTRYAISMLFKGNLSQDGRMISLQSPKSNGTYDVYSFDISTGTKGTAKNFSSSPGGIYSSPSGQYVVINWDDTNTEVYDKNMNFVRKLPVNISHFDMTFDSDGVTEIAVGSAKPSGGGKLIKVPLLSGGSTVLTDRGYVDHTSTRNIASAGWAITSFMEQSPSPSSYRTFLDEIDAVKLDGSGQVRRLAHARSLVDLGLDADADYYSQPQASVSPDGTKVIFASNWDSSNSLPINAFVIDLFRPGDFNRDGLVDAADYAVWRKGLGTTYAQTDYNIWRAHLGQSSGSGSALLSAAPLSAAVPEPTTTLLVGLAVSLIVTSHRKRSFIGSTL